MYLLFSSIFLTIFQIFSPEVALICDQRWCIQPLELSTDYQSETAKKTVVLQIMHVHMWQSLLRMPYVSCSIRSCKSGRS